MHKTHKIKFLTVKSNIVKACYLLSLNCHYYRQPMRSATPKCHLSANRLKTGPRLSNEHNLAHRHTNLDCDHYNYNYNYYLLPTTTTTNTFGFYLTDLFLWRLLQVRLAPPHVFQRRSFMDCCWCNQPTNSVKALK